MLSRFEVSNFKNFGSRFVFDLSSPKNYEFNRECVCNGVVADSVIYGPNACGKTNLGYAVLDIKTHLTDGKIREAYTSNYLNATRRGKHAEFTYTFRFDKDVVEYAYRKASVKQLLAETLRINGKTVISLDRNEGSTAEFGLKGTETLNPDLGGALGHGTGSLSAIKYVANSTVLADTAENAVFREFVTFVEHMRHTNTEDTWGVRASPTELSEVFAADGDMLRSFEAFLRGAGVDCKLSILEVGGEERLAFDFGEGQIDFTSCASTGTLSLASQYLHLMLLRLIREKQELEGRTRERSAKCANDSSRNAPAEGMSSPRRVRPFIFVDEFDAFYHHATARHMVETLKKTGCQIVLTTHNTGIMSNDLLRPDCYFIMSPTDIKPACAFSEKELRKAHNIEKMYRAGVFGG